METLWQSDDEEFSVTYPMSELMRRATLKIKIHDREIPMTSDLWGKFPMLISRYGRIKNWEKIGVSRVKVFYDPDYYIRNINTIQLLDPLHMYFVLKYSAQS